MPTKKQRQIALLKVLAAAAWSDGRIDGGEVNHLKRRMLAFGLDAGETAGVHELLERPVPYSRCEELTRELLAMLTSPDERREALREVEELLKADGDFGLEERELLDNLGGVMDAMGTVDGFLGRITGLFRSVFAGRPGDPGQVTEYLKNSVLQRLNDLSEGGWKGEIDADTLNRYTLFGAVLGRMAHLDDGMSDEELAAIRGILESRFDLKPPLLDWVVQSVREAATTGPDRQGLLSEFNRISDMDERRELLEAAFHVAAATGGVSDAEAVELRTISNFLWIDPRDFHAIRARAAS